MEFLGFCCACPVIVASTGFSIVLWRRGFRRAAVGCGIVLVILVGGATFSEIGYIVLEEGVVGDACLGDASGIRWRLSLGGDPNARTDDGLGALECAATNGHLAAAEVLLAHGADPDAKPEHEEDPNWAKTPREWAMANKDPQLTRLFARYPKRRP